MIKRLGKFVLAPRFEGGSVVQGYLDMAFSGPWAGRRSGECGKFSPTPHQGPGPLVNTPRAPIISPPFLSSTFLLHTASNSNFLTTLLLDTLASCIRNNQRVSPTS